MSLTRKYADFSLEDAILSLLDSSMDTALEQTEDFPSEEAKTIKRLAKTGLKSESFAREALDLAKIYEALMPRALDLERFERTIAQRDAIRSRLRKAQLLVQRLQVLSVLLGVDSYSDALDVYHSLKRHGRGQEMQAIVKDLGRIFKRGKPVKEESAQQNGTEGTDETDERPINNQRSTINPLPVPPVGNMGETPMLRESAPAQEHPSAPASAPHPIPINNQPSPINPPPSQPRLATGALSENHAPPLS